jgi:demethylmenaquinone methyltransferase/2-methoxy-6-polyprenyl-1,4-benzoquinol methylase
MSTTVFMKMLEQNPAKYDRGMRIFTLGRIDRIKREIAAQCVEPGDRVLEIGCGTGSLAALMTERGAQVLGIDVSEPMLAVARANSPDAEIVHASATEIDHLEEARFDRIVATLVFSELSEDELDYVLRSSARLLNDAGTLVVADEVLPSAWWQRLVLYLVRWPLAVLTFLLTQNTTHTLKGFERRLERAGYRILSRKPYLLGSLALVVAEKT